MKKLPILCFPEEASPAQADLADSADFTDSPYEEASPGRNMVKHFVPEAFSDWRLEDYPVATTQHRKALAAAKRYVAATPSCVSRPFVLFGRQGSGKTMLASCMFNALAGSIPDREAYSVGRAAGTLDNVAFKKCAELLPWFRQDSEDTSQSPAQKRDHIMSCFLAVLDDLDKFPAGEWSNELFNLIDCRLCDRKLTIITMNLSPSQLAGRYGEAGLSIADRLVRDNGIFVQLDDKLILPGTGD